MKKTIGGILLLLAAFTTTKASIIQAGPRIGVSTSRIGFDRDLKKSYDPEIGVGYQLGAVTRIALPIIYIQPELLFSYSKAKYQSHNEQHTLSYQKIDMPMMLGLKLLGLLRVQVGPIFSLLMSAKDNDLDVTSDYNKLSTGYQVGLGLDIYKFLIDLKYEGSLSKFGNKLGGVPVEHRTNLLILSVGINVL